MSACAGRTQPDFHSTPCIAVWVYQTVNVYFYQIHSWWLDDGLREQWLPTGYENVDRIGIISMWPPCCYSCTWQGQKLFSKCYRFLSVLMWCCLSRVLERLFKLQHAHSVPWVGLGVTHSWSYCLLDHCHSGCPRNKPTSLLTSEVEGVLFCQRKLQLLFIWTKKTAFHIWPWRIKLLCSQKAYKINLSL